MKIGQVFPDLLRGLGTAASVEDGLRLTLRRLVKLTGADGGALRFEPPRGGPLIVVATGRGGPALEAGLRALVTLPPDGASRPRPARGRAPRAIVRRATLGAPGRPVGELALSGPPRALGRLALPGGFGRELGAAIEQVWRLQQHTLRINVLNEITRLLVSGDALEDVFRSFASGLARLVTFDSLSVRVVDAERAEFEVIAVLAGSESLVTPADGRLPLEGTLLARVVAVATPVRVDDLDSPGVPEDSRRLLTEHGYRSALLVPLVSGGGVFGAVTLASRRRAAFDEADVEVATDLARPLASAIEQRRLLEESRRRAEELAALYSTSQLITARLDVASVLDRISRAVTALIGSTGCGIGLLEPGAGRLVHAAAHGFKSAEWRALAMPVGEGIIGQRAQSGVAIRVGGVRADA